MVQHLVPSDTEYSGNGNRIFCKLNSLNNANCYLYFMDIKTVYPLIVPANYHVKDVWAFPHKAFNNTNYILTWVSVIALEPMYMTQDTYHKLSADHPNWNRQALENLRHATKDNENFFTHFKKTSDNSKLLFLAFENADGIGSSRILLKPELSKIFSNGYYIALPDRNFGLAIAKDIGETELKKTKILVKKMYKVATSPMSPNLHEPIDFDLPPEWLTPIDENYSQLLINETINLS